VSNFPMGTRYHFSAGGQASCGQDASACFALFTGLEIDSFGATFTDQGGTHAANQSCQGEGRVEVELVAG
jgi:hypothetical protein